MKTDRNVSAVPASIDETLKLLSRGGYVADRSLATVVYLALKMGRPLFLEGEAGVGKTEVAKVLSATLGRRLLRLQCYEGLDIASALYEWNYAAQMIAIRIAEAEGIDRERLTSDIFSERFLVRRPLLEALSPDPAGAPVLLVDEVDRADEAFEAFLLEVLADFQVTIPELGTVKALVPPIVIVTSNRTREVHDALKRRCLYHWIDYPSLARELAIVRAKVPESAEKLSRDIVGFVQQLRKEDLFKAPGTAETLDWASALVALDAKALEPALISDTLGVVLKYQDDVVRFDQPKIEQMLRELAGGAEGGGMSAKMSRRVRARAFSGPHRRVRARVAPRRHAGRARRGGRCGEGGRDRGHRAANGFLLGAARGAGEAPRARSDLQRGVPPLLAPPPRLRAHHGRDAAGGTRSGQAARGAAPRRGSDDAFGARAA